MKWFFYDVNQKSVMKKLFLSLLIAATSLACNSTKTSAVNNQIDDYKTIAKEKYGDNATFKHSPDEQFVLVVKEDKGTPKQPQNSISYFVYDLKKRDIVLEDTFGPGSVKWFENNKLEVFQIPGTMPEGKDKNDFTYIYNVETGEKTVKSEYTN